MPNNNNILEDIARVTTNIAATAFESVKNVQDSAKDKAQDFARHADLVSREEFEAVKSTAARISSENQEMLKSIAELKKQVQNISSSLDVLKEKSSKQTAAKPVEQKTNKAEVEKIVEPKIKELVSTSLKSVEDNISKNLELKASDNTKIIEQLNSKIAQLESKINSKPESKPKAESKKEAKSNKSAKKAEPKPEVKVQQPKDSSDGKVQNIQDNENQDSLF